jgi:DNA-binding IclR family transcriptional regulator
LSVSVPSARINDVIQSELTVLVMETARDISAAISISA